MRASEPPSLLLDIKTVRVSWLECHQQLFKTSRFPELRNSPPLIETQELQLPEDHRRWHGSHLQTSISCLPLSIPIIVLSHSSTIKTVKTYCIMGRASRCYRIDSSDGSIRPLVGHVIFWI